MKTDTAASAADPSTPSVTGAPRPVAVSELKRAWTAVQAGAFRQPRDRAPKPTLVRQVAEPHEHDARDQASGSMPSGSSMSGSAHLMVDAVPGGRWRPAPAERVLPVVGAAGSTGCSTVALALATAAAEGTHGRDAGAFSGRVVECCSAPASGLAAATSAELGRHESGWVRGSRGRVLLERVGEVLASPGQVPAPASMREDDQLSEGQLSDGQLGDAGGAECLTVIDTGWEVGQLVAGGGWLGDAVRKAPVVVVVARPTIPSFRRLEAALELLEADHGASTQVAVLGGRRKRWAKGVEHSAGPRTRAALREGRVHEIPEDRHLAGTGLSSAALPPWLVAAAERLLGAALAAGQGLGPDLGPVLGHDLDAGLNTESSGVEQDVDDNATSHTRPHPAGGASTSTTASHPEVGAGPGTKQPTEGTSR